MPRIPARGVLRFLLLPWVYVTDTRVVMQALKRWPDSRQACFIGRSFAFCAMGLLARRLGLVRKVVFRVGDYYPVAGISETQVVHILFQLINRFVVRHANEVWHISQRLHDVHTDRHGRRLTRVPESIVPASTTRIPSSINFGVPSGCIGSCLSAMSHSSREWTSFFPRLLRHGTSIPI